MVFYKCNHCGDLITFLTDKQVVPTCCGEKMVEVIANTTDAAKEKHVPAVTVEGHQVRVNVGSVDHPMLEEHHIEFILLETNQGFQKKDLKPGEAPHAVFALAEGEKPVAVYENCNLHGLWKAEIL